MDPALCGEGFEAAGEGAAQPGGHAGAGGGQAALALQDAGGELEQGLAGVGTLAEQALPQGDAEGELVGALTGSFAEQLMKIGLARNVGGETLPLRAAVLLFAEEPGSLLAAYRTTSMAGGSLAPGGGLVNGALVEV